MFFSPFSTAPPGWLSGVRVGLITLHVKISRRWLWKEKLCWYWCEKARKHMCLTDRHDMTLAVKVGLNLSTTNQRKLCPLVKNQMFLLHYGDIFSIHIKTAFSKFKNIYTFLQASVFHDDVIVVKSIETRENLLFSPYIFLITSNNKILSLSKYLTICSILQHSPESLRSRKMRLLKIF